MDRYIDRNTYMHLTSELNMSSFIKIAFVALGQLELSKIDFQDWLVAGPMNNNKNFNARLISNLNFPETNISTCITEKLAEKSGGPE